MPQLKNVEVTVTDKVKLKKKDNCNSIKIMMLKLFLIIRYYLNFVIDYMFGLFLNKNKKSLNKCSNPIILESNTSLAHKIRSGQLKSEKVVQAFIDRIKETNGTLNALVDARFDEALKEAREIDKYVENGKITDSVFEEKPFLGIPFTVKESTAVKGLSHTFGIVRRKGVKADYDADIVILMKKAGAICIGVTNIPQLNLWQESSNPIYGTTNNPYDTSRNAGGSSGGEASILAAGGTALSIGSDIGGSGRIPAFMCGVFGHKPTSHLISIKGLTYRTGSEKQTMVVVCPLTRYAVDIIPLLKVLMDENSTKLNLDEPVDISTIRIFYIKNPKDPFVSPFRSEMKETLESVINHFKDISKNPPESIELEGTKYAGRLWKYWLSQESGANFRRDIMNREEEANPYLEILKHFTVGGDFSTSTIYNFINGLLPNPNEDWAKEQTETLKQKLLEKLGNNGILLYPSSPWPAAYHYTSYLRPWDFNLYSIWNLLKFPVTQVPLGLKHGLPVGIQVVAAPYEDRLCIAVARELEKSFGGYVPPFQTE